MSGPFETDAILEKYHKGCVHRRPGLGLEGVLLSYIIRSFTGTPVAPVDLVV